MSSSRFRVWFLLALLAGVLAWAGWRGLFREARARLTDESQAHAQDPGSPAGIRLLPTLADQRAFDDEVNRLKPDRRFGLGLAAVDETSGHIGGSVFGYLPCSRS